MTSAMLVQTISLRRSRHTKEDMDNSETALIATTSTLRNTTGRLLSGLKAKGSVSGGSKIRINTSHQSTTSASLLSIFTSSGVGHQQLDIASHPLHWYLWWLEDQLRQLPSSILSIVADYGPHENEWSPPLVRIFSAIALSATTSQYPSIDDIVGHLQAEGLFEERSSKEENSEARSLVFAMLGWQTMLYKPALGTCPPQQLAVVDEQDGYRGQAFMALKQFQGSAKRPLHEFLMGFGILLPPADLCTSANMEFKKSFEELTTLEPSGFNAFLLDSIGHIKIKWIDNLSCHLEFDERANTIFLFRYPSFCTSCSQLAKAEKPSKAIIHAGASPASSSRQWASEEDITKMLQETLLSYRLLFAQDKQARKLYRRLAPFANSPQECQDQLLHSLCGRKSFQSAWMPSDQDTYDLRRDFPILRSRLVGLHRTLSASKPRGWRELWRDKRDSAGWFTFWIVLIFGGVAIALSALQVLLQIIQLAIGR